MKASTYRDMHLLNEVTQTPDATQRDLAKRIGAALGLTNLMLRRLAKKGYIKIVNVKNSRLRYLITPQGIMEKTRLTREYIQHSLQFYQQIRTFLQVQLTQAAKARQRRVILWGTGELAEIAFLSIHEMGLELVGVIEDTPEHDRFLGYPVQGLQLVSELEHDLVLVASLRCGVGQIQQLLNAGEPMARLILMPIPTLQGLVLEEGSWGQADADPAAVAVGAATSDSAEAASS